IEHARKSLASYKRPRSVDFIAELPRNPSGKVLKKDLREPFWKGHSRRVGGLGSAWAPYPRSAVDLLQHVLALVPERAEHGIQPAVDRERHARDERRLFREQEGHDAADLLGLTHAAERVRSGERSLGEHLVLVQGAEDRCVDHARADRVHTDLVL